MKPTPQDRNRKPLSATKARGPRNRKLPYAKPRVDPAGSVFSRTRALAGAGKDIINGSGLL